MAATPGLVPKQGGYPSAYRPRNPRATPLYQLLDKHYETVKGVWDERFERRYGFWRGYWDTALARYLADVDPLTCRRCGEQMKIIAFISEPSVIHRILDHLEQKGRPRAPPEPSEIAVH